MLLVCAVMMALLSGTSHGGTRLVSGAGAITETLYALGVEKELVAVDTSSMYPEAARNLPKIGYARALSAEGVLSMRPTLLLLTEDAGPEQAIKQLKVAGVNMLLLDAEHTPDGAARRIREIGEAVGRKEAAEKLLSKLEGEIADVKAKVAAAPARPRVMFIYTRSGGVMNVAGKGTSAATMVELAGGVNAVTDYEGYRSLTAEGAVLARPDYILVTQRGLESAGGIDALLKQPGLALTPAGKSRQVIAIDDLLLLGYGPRTGEAALELFEKLHP